VFLERLNTRLPGLRARLPTEAEWEYACRAGTTTPFSFGEAITIDQVNHDDRYPYYTGATIQRPWPVKTLPPNPWGLYEMHGNVWEWCSDGYAESFPDGLAIDPVGPTTSACRVARGGGWSEGPFRCRSAYRTRYIPTSRVDTLGFRVLIPIQQNP
jgi:sulfatase modifying factor 1